jgi:Predicted membrane protein
LEPYFSGLLVGDHGDYHEEVPVGYVVSFLLAALFGFMVDFFTAALSSIPTGTWFTLLYFVAGYLTMCVAIAMMVNSKIPLMIFDSFVHDLSIFFHITYRRMKTIFDIACLTISFIIPLVFLSHLAGAGIGTVIMALITGSGVHIASNALRKVIVIRPWSKRLSNMAA